MISSILCIIETNIKCSPKINFCEIKDKDNNTYIDNFNIYYENLSEIKDKAEEIIYEICVNIFGMICKFFALYFDILIIQYLTPVHIIFYSSLFYFIIKIIVLFCNKIKTNHFFNNEKRFYIFLLDLLGNFITIFGFLIYLEIIELRFCKLNYNTRKNIEKRRVEEIKQKDIYDGYDGFNEEDEKNERDRKSLFSELESNSL